MTEEQKQEQQCLIISKILEVKDIDILNNLQKMIEERIKKLKQCHKCEYKFINTDIHTHKQHCYMFKTRVKGCKLNINWKA